MNKKGFTLLELTIVMAIATILLGAATPVAVKRVQIAYAQKAAQEMNILEDAAKNYYATNDTWPNTVQDLKDDGYLSPFWVAKNAWGNDYVTTPAADGKSFSVASNVPSDLQGVLLAALPQSSSAAQTVTSVIPIPGEEASLEALVHRTTDDEAKRSMTKRLVTPTVVGEVGAGARGMNYSNVDDPDGSGLVAGEGRMKDIWVENLNNGAGGYVSDIAGADIAVGTGVLYHGNQIPLPYFSDGTQATQAQCRWIVGPHYYCDPGSPGYRHTRGWYFTTSSNRVVTCLSYTVGDGAERSWSAIDGNYIIIGVR